MRIPTSASSWLRQLACLQRNSSFCYLPIRSASSGHGGGAEPCKPEDEDPWANVKPVKTEHKRVTMDDYPVPCGSWQESWNNRRRQGTIQLTLGALLLGGTLYYVWQYDPFHWEKLSAPKKYMKNPPAFESPVLEPNRMKEYEKTLPPIPAALPVPILDRKSTEVRKTGSFVDPSKIPEIPNHVPYLIVGGGTAAFSAFRSLRANDPNAAVLVVTEDSYNPYMRPPLSKELWYADEAHRKELRFKPWSGKERGIFFEHQEFYVEPKILPFTENGGVAVLKNTSVTSLDPKHQKVTLKNGWEIFYDRLLLAPGGRPRSLPCFEKAGREVTNNVTIFRGISDFKKLDAATRSAKKVVIVGGGFLGSELACSLAHRGKSTGMEVHQVYPEKGNLGRVLPEYLSEWTTRKIQTVDGVKLYREKFVTNAWFADGQVVVKLNDGQEIPADHVVVAIGIEPDTRLASSSGLEVDDVLGGFKVNAELEARSNIWVAGDAASFFDVTLGRRRMEHHDHAVATGRLAGENMLGKGKPFWHQSMFWSDLGPEIGFEAVGLVDASLETVAVFAQNTNPSSDESQNTGNGKGSRAPTNLRIPGSDDDYSKGIIFYLKDRLVVGILLWNVFNHVSIARKVIKDQKSFEDLSDLARLFDLHEDKDASGDMKEEADKKDH